MARPNSKLRPYLSTKSVNVLARAGASVSWYRRSAIDIRFSAVHDVGDGDVLRAAGRAEVAGDARPHRVGGQHALALAGVDHGEQRAGRIFHVGAAGAGAAATSALEAMDSRSPPGVASITFSRKVLFSAVCVVINSCSTAEVSAQVLRSVSSWTQQPHRYRPLSPQQSAFQRRWQAEGIAAIGWSLRTYTFVAPLADVRRFGWVRGISLRGRAEIRDSGSAGRAMVARSPGSSQNLLRFAPNCKTWSCILGSTKKPWKTRCYCCSRGSTFRGMLAIRGKTAENHLPGIEY